MKFVAYEIHPCAEFYGEPHADEPDTYFEQLTPEELRAYEEGEWEPERMENVKGIVWTLYGRLPNGEVMAINDAKDKASAEEIRDMLPEIDSGAALQDVREQCLTIAGNLMCDADNDNPCTAEGEDVKLEDFCNPCTARIDLWALWDPEHGGPAWWVDERERREKAGFWEES